MTDRQSAKDIFIQAMEELLHKKPFSKISVNELCEYVNISRTSFYHYYEDKYQLFSCCLDRKHEFFNQLRITYEPKEFLVVMLEVIQNENRFFYNAFGASEEEEVKELTYQFFYQEFSNIIEVKMCENKTISGPVEVVSAFYIGGLTTAIIRWIKSDYKLSKEELSACLYDLLRDII